MTLGDLVIIEKITKTPWTKLLWKLKNLKERFDMKLNTVEEIKKIGLEEFVDKYKLKFKDFGHKFLLRYDQLNTPKNQFTNECRGLVLSKDLEVMSSPFFRFSSYNENSRKTLDWDSATYWEKTDGTMIHFYWDKLSDKWCVGTIGSPEAIDKVSCRDKVKGTHENFDFTLTDLFFKTCERNEIWIDDLDKGCTYIFELATSYNVVVNNYENDVIKLLGVRDLVLGEELNFEQLNNLAKERGWERPQQFFFNSEKEMLDSLKNVKFGDINFEGYVVVDKDFNRLKVKSNTYVIFHQFNGDLESKWRLVDVALANEVEEVGSVFPELKEPLERIKSNLDRELEPIREAYERLRGQVDTMESKDFFIEAQKAVEFNKSKKILLSVITSLKKDNTREFDDVVFDMNKKSLYKLVK